MKKCRVLIADDHRDSANSLAYLVRAWGHEVVVAYDGEEAVQICEQFKPHVAVLDVTMPHKNGYEVADKIKPTGCITVIMSGHAEEEHRIKAKEAGIEHFLIKPVNTRYLERLMAGICEDQLVKSV